MTFAWATPRRCLVTRSELRQFVRDLTLTEDHETSDALIDVFLQEGYFKITTRRKWSWLKQIVEQFAASTNPYDMTNFDVHPVMAIYDLSEEAQNQLPLTQITRSEATFYLHNRIQSGYRPRFYWVEGQLLYMHPDPEPAALFNVSYYADRGWAPGDAEVPSIPEAYHTTALGNYAIHRIWERQEDFDRSDAYLGRFEVAMQEMNYDENTQNVDRPKVFGELVGSRGRARNMPWLDGV